PLFWLSLAFLTGILFGDFFGWPGSVWLWLSAAFLVLALLVWRLPGRFAEGLRRSTHFPRLRFLPEWTQPSYSILWLLLALSLGGLRFASQQPQWSPELIAWHNDQDVPLVIEGVVIAPPEEGDGVTRLRLQAERVRTKDELLFQEVKGVILARVPPLDGWRYGDRVRLEGKLETPPVSETFSYREYLARQGIYSYFSCYVCQGCPTPIDQECARLLQHDQANPIRSAIYALRQKAYQLVYQFLPDPEASLLAGILLGIEARIPEAVDQAFRDTGTSHIIAISGFNFAIVAGLFSSLFTRLLGRWRGMLAAFLAIALYALLAGANAAVVRAAIMGGMSVFALQLG
ncbi:MAG: ComEC/Rec2 family competence protein, partial [Anaerolineaceae bacterium]|nr:ComEC/Rec2 family competence protein [Anaerolineaceae bacterium]